MRGGLVWIKEKMSAQNHNLSDGSMPQHLGRVGSDAPEALLVQVCVTIEVPRGSFLKRDSDGAIAFVSPLPCPFNYGSVRGLAGGDADWLDAVVLGPRLNRGTRIQVPVHGAICFVDAGAEDLKLVCSHATLSPADSARVLRFFNFYAVCKRVLNRLNLRFHSGPTVCRGWCAWPAGKRHEATDPH